MSSHTWGLTITSDVPFQSQLIDNLYGCWRVLKSCSPSGLWVNLFFEGELNYSCCTVHGWLVKWYTVMDTK